MAAVELNSEDYAVLNYIKTYVEEHGYAPSIREICDGTGYKSSSTVHGHISNLIYAGLLETDHTNTPRALRIAGYKLVKEEENESN